MARTKMFAVYCDCLQVIMDWPYWYCEKWVDKHTREEIEKFISEKW